MRIDDPDDPRVEPYRSVRDRDVAGRHGVFVAEGDVVVRALLSTRCRFGTASVLMSDARAAADPEWLNALPDTVPTYLAGQSVMDRVVGFPIHRGLLALGRRVPPVDPETLLPPAENAALVLGLIGFANHDNVGAAFRNAAAFGADVVLLDRESCDPLYRKAIRVSAGTALTLPFAQAGSVDDMVILLTKAGFDVFALGPAAAHSIDTIAWPKRTALLLGSEGHGLPTHLLSDVRWTRIDMAPGIDSLNVAAAGAIALHAVRQSRTRASGIARD